MKENVSAIICNTNMAVPSVLSLVMENPAVRFVILSDTQNIITFLNSIQLNNCNIIKYNNYSRFFSYAPKKELIKAMRAYNVKQVYFFHFDYGSLANWYLKKISRKSRVYFCYLYDRKPYKKLFFKECYKLKLLEFLHYGIWMDYHDEKIPSAPPSFYRKINAETIKIDVKQDCIKSAVERLLPISNKGKVVLLAGSILSRNVVDKDEYSNKINELIGLIGVDKVVVKCHPRFDDMSQEEKGLEQISSFIPGNLLVYYYDIFIGYDSLLLVEAAHAGKKAISLINVFDGKDVILKNNSIRYLEERLEGRGEIGYPNSVSEAIYLCGINTTIR